MNEEDWHLRVVMDRAGGTPTKIELGSNSSEITRNIDPEVEQRIIQEEVCAQTIWPEGQSTIKQMIDLAEASDEEKLYIEDMLDSDFNMTGEYATHIKSVEIAWRAQNKIRAVLGIRTLTEQNFQDAVDDKGGKLP